MKDILVLGGGIAGVETAIFLKKQKLNVTLVSDRDYFYIYPTSIWIPTGESEFKDMCIDLKELQAAHGFKLIIDAVETISAKDKQIKLQSGTILANYDYLVLAMGAHKMKHKGIENTLSICGAPEQSLRIKEKIDALIEKGHGKIAFGFGGNPKDTSAVRGGPGFELLFNLDNQLKKLGIRENFELTFFAPMPEPGKRMGPQALKMMDTFFQRLNIHKHFGKKILEFKEDGILFEDDSLLESDFTMFIPAGDGHTVIKESDLPTNEAGFVKTNDYSQVIFEANGEVDSNMPTNIYAVGDIASLEGYEWRAKQGHIAEVMARNVANNIKQRELGTNKFKGYHEHLNILCVMDSGDGAAFVYRDEKRAFMLPMPLIGHWLKKAWGLYFRYSKLGKFPRIPGM